MAYNERLAECVRELLGKRRGLTEKKMFGGLAFMIRGHMCCGVVGERLMVRVGPEKYEQALSREHAEIMDFTGKPMRGLVFVHPAGLRTRRQLSAWVAQAVQFVETLGPKPKPR